MRKKGNKTRKGTVREAFFSFLRAAQEARCFAATAAYLGTLFQGGHAEALSAPLQLGVHNDRLETATCLFFLSKLHLARRYLGEFLVLVSEKRANEVDRKGLLRRACDRLLVSLPLLSS